MQLRTSPGGRTPSSRRRTPELPPSSVTVTTAVTSAVPPPPSAGGAGGIPPADLVRYPIAVPGVTVAIVGDVLHSRVARSNIWGLLKLGAQVGVCGPRTLLPRGIEERWGSQDLERRLRYAGLTLDGRVLLGGEPLRGALISLTGQDVAAQRQIRDGEVMQPPEGLYDEFCARFPYSETEDQARSIEDAIGDLASGRSMDRLICGDVGFGKTEVAIRAAFKAVQDGKQVAVLVPTTLLAEQHFQNFSTRFADWPVKIAELSRFRSPKEVKAALEGIANGSVVRSGRLVSIGVPKDLIGLFQIVEYLRAFLMARLAWAEMGAAMLISGAFGIFRRQAALAVGGYSHGTVGEDMELVVRLHRLYRLGRREDGNRHQAIVQRLKADESLAPPERDARIAELKEAFTSLGDDVRVAVLADDAIAPVDASVRGAIAALAGWLLGMAALAGWLIVALPAATVPSFSAASR